MSNPLHLRMFLTRGALACGLILLAGAAHAVVLDLPFSWDISASNPAADYGIPLDSVSLNGSDGATDYLYSSSSLSGAAIYYWYYGCSPTAGGMMIAYWDAQAGREDLFAGSAQAWNQATKDMVASPAHIAAGQALGYTYGSYKNHTADCLADFMKTDNSATYANSMAQGLVDYAFWDNPNTLTNESLHAYTSVNYVPGVGGSFNWSKFTAEIDAGRPVLLNVLRYDGSAYYGHTVFAYGYQTYNGLNWYAVYDTWGVTGGGGNNDGSYWNIAGQAVDNMLVNGIEWWPFVTYGSGYPDTATYPRNYEINNAVFLYVDEQPEPATCALFIVGGVALVAFRKRRRA